MKALKTQLKFRKEVILQIPEKKETFNVTKSVEGKKSRKGLGSQELSVNLKALIRQAIVKDAEGDGETHMLVGKRVRHRFREPEGDKWYPGKIISQVHQYKMGQPM